jgi:hypothetical protein
VDVGSVANVSEIHSVSIFRVGIGGVGVRRSIDYEQALLSTCHEEQDVIVEVA